MQKIIINIDAKLKAEFQDKCRDAGVKMTDVLIGAIKGFNKNIVSSPKTKK